MMIYKNMKAMFQSIDGSKYIVDIVTGVLQGDTLAPYLCMICLNSIIKTSIHLIKENRFTQLFLKRLEVDDIQQKL